MPIPPPPPGFTLDNQPDVIDPGPGPGARATAPPQYMVNDTLSAQPPPPPPGFKIDAPTDYQAVAEALGATAAAKQAIGLFLQPYSENWQPKSIGYGTTQVGDARVVNAPPDNPDELANYIPNEKLRNAVAAGADVVTGFVPHSVGDALKMFAPAVQGVEQLSDTAKAVRDYLKGKSVEEAVRANMPGALALKDAEQTLPFSRERFSAGFNTVAQMLLAKALTEGGKATEGAKIAPEAPQNAPEPAPRVEVAPPHENPELGPAPQQGEPNASPVTSPESLPERPFRPQLGEGPSLRPEGEAADVRAPAGEAPEPVPRPGADVPGNAEPPPDKVTGIANALTSQERDARGIAPAEEQPAHSWEQAMKEAAARDAEGPTLVAELTDHSRALSDTEDALLLREQIKAESAHDAAVRDVNANPGDPEALARLEAARNRVQAIYDIDKESGREGGRGLNARKMLADRNFTLAKMEATVRAEANKGEPLSQRQIKDVSDLHARLAETQAKLSAYEARDAFNAALKEAKRQKSGVYNFRDFVNRQADFARKRQIERGARLYSGIDPTSLVDEAIIGASHIVNGAAKFAEWSNKMIDEFGERIRPHLDAIYKEAKKMVAAANARPEPTRLTDAMIRMAAGESKFERQIGADKARIRKTTAEYQRRTEAKDTSPLPKKAPPRMDKQKAKLMFERDEAINDYYKMLAREKFRQSHVIRKIAHYVGEAAIGLPRSIKSAFDLSAVFRQGGLLVSGHPIKGATDIGPMLKGMLSDRRQFEVMQEIKARPNYPRYKRAGLDITEAGGLMAKREEIFRSEIAEKIPGVKASERAYTTFLNRIRTDTFDGMSGLLESILRRKLRPGEDRLIANYINVASGRGNMGRFKPAANALSKLFWSPQLAVSRVQYLAGQPLWHKAFSGEGGSVAVRALIATEYARTLAGIGLMAAIAKVAGAQIEKDPTSGNFGIRFGNTRIDITAGLKSYINYFSRLALGRMKNQKGGITKLGERYGSPTAGSLTLSLLRGKLAPAQGSIFSAIEGTDAIGRPTSAINEAIGFYVPLSPQDVGDALKTEGVPEKTILSLLAIGGMSTNNYEPMHSQDRKGEKARIEQRDKALLHGDLGRAWELTKFR